jgi:hypothetical protein
VAENAGDNMPELQSRGKGQKIFGTCPQLSGKMSFKGY